MHIAIEFDEVREQDQRTLNALDHWKLCLLFGRHGDVQRSRLPSALTSSLNHLPKSGCSRLRKPWETSSNHEHSHPHHFRSNAFRLNPGVSESTRTLPVRTG